MRPRGSEVAIPHSAALMQISVSWLKLISSLSDVRAEWEAPSISHFVLPNGVCIEFKINCTTLMSVETAVLLVFRKVLGKQKKKKKPPNGFRRLWRFYRSQLIRNAESPLHITFLVWYWPLTRGCSLVTRPGDVSAYIWFQSRMLSGNST